MIPHSKTGRLGLIPRQLFIFSACFCCAVAAILLWRRGEPVDGKARATIAIRSADFANEGPIPARCTCDGANLSPQLEWQSPPAGTKSLALVMHDPDAPIDFVHWIAYNIPPAERQLLEGASPHGSLPLGSQQGSTSFDRSEYGGPCPPRGTHHYFFRLYALDIHLDLAAGATRRQLEAAMTGHILAEGQLVGTYQRSTQ